LDPSNLAANPLEGGTRQREKMLMYTKRICNGGYFSPLLLFTLFLLQSKHTKRKKLCKTQLAIHTLTKAGPVERMSSSLSAFYETTLVYTDLSANNMSPKQDADWSNCRDVSFAKMITRTTPDVGITNSLKSSVK
jgi:hypothetical protein